MKNTTKTGSIGEDIACKYLISKNFTILERNYLKKWGEIDIVAKKDNRIHFVEVKTVSYETKQLLRSSEGGWRPEEMVHQHKLHQISKALVTWIAENNYDGDWQIDVIALRMVPNERYAVVKYIDNVIIET